MKKYLFLVLSIMWCSNVMAVTYLVNTSGNPFDSAVANVLIEEDAVNVYNNGTINGEIIMDAPVVNLYNNGTINGNIDVNGNNVFVYNNGVMNYGIINTGGISNVTQVITQNTNIDAINVSDSMFTVRVENVSNLNFSDIKDINATAFVIQDSWIIIDDFSDWQNWDRNAIGSGVVHLIIADKNTINANGEFIKNVLGADSVIVQIQNLDSSERTQVGNNFFLKIVRETNYDIINNETIEKIRTSNPDDKLFLALDSATDIDEINRIKNKSYRFNHGILLRPIRILNNFSLMNNIKDKNNFGLGFAPSYIVSDKFNSLGGRIYVGNNYDDLYFSVGFNFNRFEYSDDINEFSGLVYGTDISLKQYINKLWINGDVGMNFTKFNANYISADNEIKNNPYGISWFYGADIGYDFDVGKNFILSPLIGTANQQYKVADVSDNNFYVRGGMNTKYSFDVEGIKYEYALDCAVSSNGDLFSGIKVGFWSITDEAGATFGAGVLKDDLDYNYQLSLDARILF